MKPQPVPASTVAIGLRFGLFIAAINIVVDFLTRLSGISVLIYSIVAGGLALVVGVTGVIVAHRAFKQANGGLMSYGQGVQIAAVALLLSGVLSSLFNYVYVQYVDPEFVDRMVAQMNDFMERNNVPESTIAENTSKLETELKPTLTRAVLKGLQNGVLGGLFLGLIISAFTKRKPADFE